LRQGRIFNIEMEPLASTKNYSARRIEHFWLCEVCSQTLEVVLDHGAVSTRPLLIDATEGQPQETINHKVA
jgi:hypothetical protein